jgi:2-polyprenyl-6-methoxyphenol hydroxylase-like FAD-dependent oxidoreductase
VANIVVLGGGVCGLAAGMLLARDGHEVTVLEADPEAVSESPDWAWDSWARAGVAQFRQPHFLQARVRGMLDRELPDIRDALLAAGGVSVNPIERLPTAIADREPRDGDERFVSVTARRPTTEWVFARAAEEEPRLTVRRGVTASGLVAGSSTGSGIPHVTGVRTESGEELRADLVVDAMGRRTHLKRWLRELDASPMHEESEDSGFVYYTRFFRPNNGVLPTPRTGGLLTPIGSFSLLTLPGDRRTWSVTLFISSHDGPLKRLKDAERWTSLAAACPLHAHWLDGEAITDVLPMGGILDRYRRLVVDGCPVVTGVALVADSWACTNPSLARGLALGLDHAARLRDVVRSNLDDPRELAEAWDATTEAEFTPWYRATVVTDRARLAEIDALAAGAPPPAPTDDAGSVRSRFPLAAQRDPDVFRAFMEVVNVLTLPTEIFSRAGFAERVLELTETVEPPPKLGPDRAELLALLA